MNTFNLRGLLPTHVDSFEPYCPTEPDEELMKKYGILSLHRLHNNENCLAPSPKARQLLKSYDAKKLSIYPQGDSFYLRDALAKKFGKDKKQFIVGNGSCEVIASVITAFCEKGDNIITADQTFAVYEWVAEYSGFEARLIPLKAHAFDSEAMLDAMDEKTKILFVCNPNNPTGTYWNKERMTDFLDKVDNRAIVVIDEAYFEYVGHDDFPNGMELLEHYPNLIIFRTFSKMYGLAALRIGYLCTSDDIADCIRRTHTVYSVNSIAQATAVAAIEEDQELIESTRQMVQRAKNRLCALFDEFNLEYICNEGNYLMVKVPMSDTLMQRKMMMKGIAIRSMTTFRCPNWIRVSLMDDSIMGDFIDAFRSIIQSKLGSR